MNTTYLSVGGVVLLVIAGLLLLRPVLAADSPKVGQVAPGFELLDQNSKQQRLSDYRGQWVVLYFYPKDDTPGCTTEACNFRDDYYKIRALQAVVLGVSLDDVSSHKEFADKYHLPFPLLADSKHSVAEAYNVLSGFGPIKFSSRQTFIIDPQGKVAHHYPRVKASRHATEIINDLKKLIAAVAKVPG